MKLKTTLGEYGAKNNSVTISDDCKTVEAWSYNWWKYIDVDSVGNVYFNNYSYSVRTSGHQSRASGILDTLGIQVHVWLHKTCRGLQGGIGNSLKWEIRERRSLIREYIAGIRKKGSWRRKNAERRDAIKREWYQIKDYKRYLNEYLDKKPIKKPMPQYWDSERDRGLEVVTQGWYDDKAEKYYYDKWVLEKRRIKQIHRYFKYFRKQNGKLKKRDLIKFLGCLSDWQEAPRSLDNIKSLLGVKGNECIIWMLRYPHTKDIEPMLPHEDSVEHKQLLSWLKRYQDHPRNIFLLEKLHTYLVNKMNRKEYTPKEPVKFPVSPVFMMLHGIKDLRLITTDFELRAEGRKQSHCIGSPMYMQGCMRGNHALNYKGYTFYLDSNMRLIETHGKHNASTPDEITEELGKHISEAEDTVLKTNYQEQHVAQMEAV